MHRRETFERVFFPEAVLREASKIVSERSPGKEIRWSPGSIMSGTVEWGFENETEFFAEYNREMTYGHIATGIPKYADPTMVSLGYSVTLIYERNSTTVSVVADNREDLLAPFAPFRSSAAEHKLPDPPSPAYTHPPLKIFIGHGRSRDWRDLKDALHDHHGYDVETFETQPRAGYTIPEVIEDMARGNALALMVLTAEDEQQDGSVRARENVVHEVGYFQGRLGNKRAILIMEEGVNEFSNIHGIVHLPYKNIREVEGQVLAIIKREFPHLGGIR